MADLTVTELTDKITAYLDDLDSVADAVWHPAGGGATVDVTGQGGSRFTVTVAEAEAVTP